MRNDILDDVVPIMAEVLQTYIGGKDGEALKKVRNAMMALLDSGYLHDPDQIQELRDKISDLEKQIDGLKQDLQRFQYD